MPPPRPRAFISYRHTEYEDTPDTDALNDEHRSWVNRFARDLDACGVEPVYEGFARSLRTTPWRTRSPRPSWPRYRTSPASSPTPFIVILTPSYLNRIGYAKERPIDQWEIDLLRPRLFVEAGVTNRMS